MTHSLTGNAFQYHDIISAVDETFALPGYASGLIYDPAQVPARSAPDAWLSLRGRGGGREACVGSRFHLVTQLTLLTRRPLQSSAPAFSRLNIKTTKSPCINSQKPRGRSNGDATLVSFSTVTM